MTQQDEIWRDVVGYEGLYRISSHGRVSATRRQGSKGGLKKTHVSTTDGYIYVNLYSQSADRDYWRVAVHILVARAFLGEPPEDHEVSHEDGDRRNPKLENLKYRTRKDNIALAKIHGTCLLGENTNSAVLTGAQVIEIKQIKAVPRDPVLGYSAIARDYGVDPETIACIFKGKTWTHIPFQ